MDYEKRTMEKLKMLRQGNINVFLNIRNGSYAQQLTKTCDITYSHLINVLQDMKRANLINLETIGRKKIITLTNKGKSVQEELFNIMEVLK